MPLFAPVAPPQILERFRQAGVLGQYHLLLAHDVVRQPSAYHDIFRKYGDLRTVIMDNSVAELGGSVDVEIVMDAVVATNSNIVVLPDVYKDAKATVENCKAALEDWPAKLYKVVRRPYLFMMVPQGQNLEEWMWCAEQFADDSRIGWWGIPRNLTDLPDPGTRFQAIALARALNPSRHIHMLGFSEDIMDDIFCVNVYAQIVEGIDSAVPIRCSSFGIPLSMTMKLPARGNWWETAQPTEHMMKDLATVRRWVQGR